MSRPPSQSDRNGGQPVEPHPSIRRITHTQFDRSIAELLLPAIVAGGALGLCSVIAFAAWLGLGGPARSAIELPTAIVVTVTPSPMVPTPFPTLAPSPMPTADVLFIGGYARVSGTDGDALRLRSDPGLQTTTLGTVAEGTVLLILDGPRDADGITWWRLRSLLDGGEGWAAELYLVSSGTP